MIRLYRKLLALYPVEYRRQFGEEMVDVFLDVRADKEREGTMVQTAFCVREMIGLVNGALRERLRSIGAKSGLSLYTRRLVMRDGFRFPKTTAVLMTIILAGIALAIEKARVIQASYSHGTPLVPLETARFTFFPTLALLLVVFYALGLAGWGILFALHRSGVHRLDEMAEERKN